MNEVIVTTGARGTGKSTLAATFLPPSEVNRAFVHDSENSMNNIVAQLAASELAFGHYVDLKARFSNLPSDDDLLTHINAGKLPWVNEKAKSSLADYYLYILDDLEKNLTPGKYSLYIHDTLEKLEAGMAAWTEQNVKKFGFGSLTEARRYGKIWNEAIYPLYEQLLASIFGRGVKTVILCSHLRTPWQGNKPVVGKVAPSGKRLLYRLSSLMLWLVNDRRNADGAPAALVLKERMGSVRAMDEKWVISRMLPERIPHCTWADIRTYMTPGFGCDLSNPAEGESMTEAEKDMISELLTDEQMRLMVLDAEKELEEAKSHGGMFVQQGPEPETPLVATLKSMAAGGKSAEEIATLVNKPPQVVRAMIGAK